MEDCLRDTRCEPPEELRGVEDFYWLYNIQESARAPFIWNPRICRWRRFGGTHTRSPGQMADAGWTYEGRAATPAEVEALRRERDEARAALKPFADVASLAEAGGEWWALVGIDDVLAARAALAKEAGDADAT
jgi:hypothetical protein